MTGCAPGLFREQVILPTYPLIPGLASKAGWPVGARPVEEAEAVVRVHNSENANSRIIVPAHEEAPTKNKQCVPEKSIYNDPFGNTKC